MSRRKADWELLRRRKGTGTFHVNGYKLVTINGKQVYEHIALAEKALGKKLPPGAEVHHYGERNDNTKLIICPDRKYHMLIENNQRLIEGRPRYKKRGPQRKTVELGLSVLKELFK